MPCQLSASCSWTTTSSFGRGSVRLLQTVSGVEVVAEAGDGREGFRLIEAHRPDVVLMDIMMPGLNGLDAAARVARTCPATRVIMLSMNAGEDSVLQALRAGAAGYLVKTADPAELELAIRAVVRGEDVPEFGDFATCRRRLPRAAGTRSRRRWSG